MNMTSDIVLETKGLTKAFGGNAVLKGVDITLRRGEVVLLQGANGSGKTTLLNILTGNLKPDAGTMRHTATLGRTWQDVRLFPTQTLEENLFMAAPRQSGENPFKAIFCPWRVRATERRNRAEVRQILFDAGLSDRAQVLAGEAKIAEAKFVALMRALRAGAQVLFLDEPLAGLDQTEIATVIKTLRTLVSKYGITLVVIEHALNIPKILQIATTVWTLKDGKLTSGEPKMPESTTNGDIQAWLRSIALNGIVREVPLPNGARLTIAPRKPNAKPVLELIDYTVNRGSIPIIAEPISFAINEGDVAVLEAPNGWGKTSLLESIVGSAHSGGTIRLFGQKTACCPVVFPLKLGVQFVRSRGTLFTNETVAENAQLKRATNGLLQSLMQRRAGALSGGEARKLSIMTAVHNSSTRVILFDEPYQALDSVESCCLYDAFRECDKTLIITCPEKEGSHNEQ